MSLFYGLICAVLTFGWMYTGEQKWIVIAVTFGVLQIVSEIVSTIAGYWIARKKLIDSLRDTQYNHYMQNDATTEYDEKGTNKL